jgi:hypothetical protein
MLALLSNRLRNHGHE